MIILKASKDSVVILSTGGLTQIRRELFLGVRNDSKKEETKVVIVLTTGVPVEIQCADIEDANTLRYDVVRHLIGDDEARAFREAFFVRSDT